MLSRALPVLPLLAMAVSACATTTEVAPPDLGTTGSSIEDLAHAANPDLGLSDLALSDLALSDLGLSDLANPDLANPDLAIPDLANPDLAIPDLANPDLAIPDLANPDLANPDLASPMCQPVTARADVDPWRVRIPSAGFGGLLDVQANG